MTKQDYTQEVLNFLYEQEKQLERSLELVRERIRETINYSDKNKVKDERN